MNRCRPDRVLVFLVVFVLIAGRCTPAWTAGPVGYVGPGAGLGMIGALLAVLCVIFLGLLGPVLYPIRLIRRRLKRRREDEHSEDVEGRK